MGFPGSHVSGKRSMMAVHHPPSLPSPTAKFSSPHFVGFSAKGSPEYSEAQAAAMSPTSTLETKTFSPVSESKHHPWDINGDSRSIGLGIIDALPDTKYHHPGENRMVVFGSRLKIQIPSPPTIEFGIKNKSSQLALLSPALRSSPSPGVFTGCLSASEMELSEDYTRVIAHGPNPRTTHIFDNRILVPSPREDDNNFLAFCHACKKSLGQGKDIFMYRGEIAYCSSECRDQEMMFDDEEMEKNSLDLDPPSSSSF